MRRPSGSSRDESIAAKWSDLRQYEEDQEAALREAHQVLSKLYVAELENSFCGLCFLRCFLKIKYEHRYYPPYIRLWDRILEEEKAGEPRDVSIS